ncbi:MAG: tRNA 2-thiocytidine(32) synthetase TtcA [Alphaproteobacteria bacterium]|nr:tRNA 2-thiocytidine(32) synthetase TtcA [Alphaproteobacteria bacterium]
MDRLERRLLSRLARASQDYGLIEPGDRIMVAVSGGKDSYVMLHLLQEVQRRVAFDVELIAVHLDQHQPGFDSGVVEAFLAARDVPYRIVREDTYSVVVEETRPGKAYCSLCSRLRRGILYTTAVDLGCTKIALGHHRDDSIETLMLNLFYSGQLKAMPPRLTSDDGRNVVIRPLIGCAEADIAALATQLGFPVQPCTVCSRQPDLKRARVKALLDELHAENDKVRGNVFAALSNVKPSHLLDPQLRELAGVEALTGAEEALLEVEGVGAGCA